MNNQILLETTYVISYPWFNFYYYNLINIDINTITMTLSFIDEY